MNTTRLVGRLYPVIIMVIASAAHISTAQNQLRNRGESFYHCINSNTAGSGDLWVKMTAVGHIWDDKPIAMESTTGGVTPPHKWLSNIRAFPEVQLQYGLFDFAMLTVESRLLTWAWKPGFVSAAAKFTTPNNKDLRFNGFGLELKYIYNFTQGPPTLGGYSGFMPEGYVIMGSTVDMKFAYELDLLPKLSLFPIRLLTNAGLRVPVVDTLYRNYQILGDAALVYSGYGFDFFAAYSIEAFNNLTHPKIMTTGPKRFLVFFSENPSYAILGGNVRYDNGIVLSLNVPLLLSLNRESRMTRADQIELDAHTGKYSIEESYDIHDPFDPWFVKWKVAASLSFPILAKMTSAEMMRNYLIMKNRRQPKRIDIDNRLQMLDNEKPSEADEAADRQKRLEEIKKRRQQIDGTE